MDKRAPRNEYGAALGQERTGQRAADTYEQEQNGP